MALSFEEFQQQVCELLPKRVHRLQFKNNKKDERVIDRIGPDGDIPEYQFQGNDPGYHGYYSHGEWMLAFNGGVGTGSSIEEADNTLEEDYYKTFMEQHG